MVFQLSSNTFTDEYDNIQINYSDRMTDIRYQNNFYCINHEEVGHEVDPGRNGRNMLSQNRLDCLYAGGVSFDCRSLT
jgi:hypothetical protein